MSDADEKPPSASAAANENSHTVEPENNQSSTSNDVQEDKKPANNTDSTDKTTNSKKAAAPSTKIKILLKPAGATPALTKDKWFVTRDKTIGSIASFVKKPLKMDATKTLFLYVKQTFAPSADVEVGKLYECFGSDGQLVLHYCMTEAWG